MDIPEAIAIKDGGLCNQTTGLPWIERDGYPSSDDHDTVKLRAMIDTIETLTLAWWFTRHTNSARASGYLDASLRVFRSWFLNETTRMNPNMVYAEGLPGKYDGAATGLIHMTRRAALFNDCAELFRHSQAWTTVDETAWQLWMSAWLKWITTHEWGILEAELNNRGNHATWMWVHTIAMAKAAGWQKLALDWASRVQAGFPSALVNQIEPSGRLPTAAARPTGAVYSMFALTAIFKLGRVIDAICRDWQCDGEATFKWDAPTSLTAAQESPRWVVLQRATTTCGKLLNPFYKNDCSGAAGCETFTVNETACRQACLATGNLAAQRNGTSCNAFSLSYVNGVPVACYLRACFEQGDGISRTTPRPVTSSSLWQKQVYVLPPQAGTGSVRRAVDYLLPYANGTKNWRADHPRQMSWEGGDWRDLAPILHQAAQVFGEQSYAASIPSITQSKIADFGAEWLKNKIHLVQPLDLCSEGEEIFGEYFDIIAGSNGGSWVTGRVQPRANMRGNLEDWSFSLASAGSGNHCASNFVSWIALFMALTHTHTHTHTNTHKHTRYTLNLDVVHDGMSVPCAGAVFELVNQRDTKGRLFGNFRVASGATIGASGTSYDLSVELRDQAGAFVGCRKIAILSVDETVLSKVGTRVMANLRGNSRSCTMHVSPLSLANSRVQSSNLHHRSLFRNSMCTTIFSWHPEVSFIDLNCFLSLNLLTYYCPQVVGYNPIQDVCGS
jgi:hypothetical protein